MLSDSDFEKKNIIDLLDKYGSKETIRILRMAMLDQSNELSDLGLKEQAIEMSEWSDLLSDLLVE